MQQSDFVFRANLPTLHDMYIYKLSPEVLTEALVPNLSRIYVKITGSGLTGLKIDMIGRHSFLH
jgi:hypothetical protein